MNYLIYALIAIAGYLFGSLSFALLIGKLFYNTDVREKGSKSAGATNVLRTLGKKAAIFVTIGDVSKGIVAYYIGFIVAHLAGINPQLCGVLGGFSAILGYNYPIFFRFKGGKGVLTSLALVLILDWRASLIALGIFVVILLLTRYVSLSSMIASVACGVLILVFQPHNPMHYIPALIAATLIVIKHKANIKRLIKGEESKIF